jgi:ATP-dependent protease ClpP protease subunit
LFDKRLAAFARNSAPPRPWYSVRNLADGEAELFIYDYIGFDPFFGGVGAADFVRDLRAINASKILLRINSPGGDISEAVTIRNALIEHPAEIETHVDGLAASSASWVGLGDWPMIMSPHAMMMIHEPWFMVGGDAEYLRKQSDVLDKFGADIAKMYVEKAGGELDTWRAAMREETWYSDEEAVAAGLADEVATQEAPATENRYDPGILAMFQHTPEHLTRNTKPQPTPQPRAADHPPELVRARLVSQRNEARRLGVPV